MKLVISKDLRKLSQAAAAEFVRIANESIGERGVFRVALSGGSTPKALYQQLVKARVAWDQVYFFIGDERNVPPDHEESNYRLAVENLFQPLTIDPEHIFRWKTEIGAPDTVADDYSTQIHIGFRRGSEHGGSNGEGISAFVGNDVRFDLVLLGLGPDAHTASLFPETMAVQFDEIAVANWVPQLDQWRFTLTFAAINNARNVMFLVSGGEKAAALKAVLEGKPDPEHLPAQAVDPADGELFWFVDRDAASELSS